MVNNENNTNSIGSASTPLGKEVDWGTKENNQLLTAVLALESKDEAKNFLRDLMTEAEITEFAKRLEAARLLATDTQYAAIIERTGLSSTTIARISKWLKGNLGGYRLILSRIANVSLHHHSISHRVKGLS